MLRRAIRAWARHQSRLVLLLRARHPLLRRPPSGARILEALGLVAPRARFRRAAWPRWTVLPELEGPAAWPEDVVAAPPQAAPDITAEPAAPEAMPAAAAREPSPDSLPPAPTSRPAESGRPAVGDRPHRELPAGWPAAQGAPATGSEPPDERASTPRGPMLVRDVDSAGPAESVSAGDRAPLRRAAGVAPAPREPPSGAGPPVGRAPEAATPGRAAPGTTPAEPARAPTRPAARADTTNSAQDPAPAPPPRPRAPPVPAPPAGAGALAEPTGTETRAGEEARARAAPTGIPAVESPTVESPPAAAGEVPTVESPPVAAGEVPAPRPASEPIEVAAATMGEALPGSRPPVPQGPPPPVAGAPPAFEERRARRPPAAASAAPRATAAESEGPSAAKAPSAPKVGPLPGPEPPLFSSAENRPIAEWRRLLIEATTVPERPAPRAASPRTAAPHPRPRPEPAPGEPVLESTRRFLRPLVGIDPATVRVHRGATADRAAAAAGADALAAGNDVVLPAAHEERSPEGLGLLAHELAHVARARSPRFVPPILRTRPAPGAPDAPVGRPRAARGAEEEAVPSDEESVATRVEGLVRSVARGAREAGSGTDLVAAPSAEMLPVSRSGALQGTAAASAGRPSLPESPAPWGELPAPWEPLPPPGGEASLAAPAPAAPATVLRAAADREVEETAPAASPAPAQGPESPAPDLDALARQVYDVLKRRLAAERRREG